jgi:gamma-glutamylputrescine oxidase
MSTTPATIEKDEGYPPSWYAQTRVAEPPVAPLDGDREADICVIGGGYSGLSVALHLARAGANVVLVEAERIGWGASGRAGGLVRVGLPRDPHWLENELGRADTIALWRLALDARAHLDWLIGRYDIACQLAPGHLRLDRSRSEVEETRRFVELVEERYGYPHLRIVEKDELASLVGAKGCRGGVIDARGGHLHPLNLALGLAAAAHAEGALLCDRTPASNVARGDGRWIVTTPNGTITAHRLVLAGGGQRVGLERKVDARLVTLGGVVAATEPLGADIAGDIIRGSHAVTLGGSDQFFRVTADHRLLFGSGDGQGAHARSRRGDRVRHDLRRMFPQLNDVRIDYSWASGVAVTRNRLPYVRQPRPGMYALGGYSGWGAVLAPYFGKLVASAIAGGDSDFDRLTRLKVPRFPVRRLMHGPTQGVAMSLLALHDRL